MDAEIWRGAIFAGAGYLIAYIINRWDKSRDQLTQAVQSNTVAIAILTKEIEKVADALSEIKELRRDTGKLGSRQRELATRVDHLTAQISKANPS